MLFGNRLRTHQWLIYFCIFFALALGGCSGALREVMLNSYPPERPGWVDQGIVAKDGYIFVTGHSRPKETEQEARDDALNAATGEFVKYCKVEVEVFDRIVETYSETEGADYSRMDLEHRASARARAFVRQAAPERWYVRHMAKMRGEKRASSNYLATVLLKVPQEEFERIGRERDIKLSLDIGLYREADGGTLTQIFEGDVLRSGDGYALYAKPSDDCYLYVFQSDETGKGYRLFPNDAYETEGNPIRAGADLWIPNPQKLLILDETTGKEKIYLFASPDPIPELEGHVSMETESLGRVIKTMGPAGIKNKRTPYAAVPPKRKKKTVEIKKKLQARGEFVYETWFWHR